ncbi:MAG: DNA polymerase-3 subunit epsilon [Pseudohongiellaceae bacterium]|jgi:DNA polymerase-3 subunit epsilon
MRQIVLDTETTGLDPKHGHRVIEIGCVEINNRRLTGNHYHKYLNPQREIDEAAIEVHGLTRHFLNDKPLFLEIEKEFLDFIAGAELVIHNAPFDVGFLNSELSIVKSSVKKVNDVCGILDTLALARKKHPGQRNSLDALCKRYGIDNSKRQLHGALLDAEILADVYLIMTSGQSSFFTAKEDDEETVNAVDVKRVFDPARTPLKVLSASAEEETAHQSRLAEIDKKSDGSCVWLQLEAKK